MSQSIFSWQPIRSGAKKDTGVAAVDASLHKRFDPLRTRIACHVCARSFNRPSALQTHMYTHTGEKPHACTIPGCGRRFAVISNLRRHFKVHSKTVSSQRLSSHDRHRYVQQLMDRASTEREMVPTIAAPKTAINQFTRTDTIRPLPLASECRHSPPVCRPTSLPRQPIPRMEPSPRNLEHARISIQQLLILK